jgi:hypothetical protein
MLWRQIAVSFVLSFAVVAACRAAPTCNISSEKRQLIESVMCGQSAVEPEYRQFGPGCVRRSVEKRLEDTAIQIHVLKLCGDQIFAAEMKDGTIATMKFMELLTPCLSEEISVSDIMDERISFVENKAANLTCSAEMREMIEARKPQLRMMVSQSKDPRIVENILTKLGIKLDSENNLSDQ